jgi:membrane protein DedA with SNARE-associated domain
MMGQVMVAAFLGAVVGDGVSFWLGYQYRREILRGWPLNRFPRLIAHSARLRQEMWHRERFLARFTAVVRAFVPLLAGIFRMSSGHFYFANVLSALVWAPLHVFPGIFVGIAIALGGVHAQQLGVLAIAAVIIGAIAWSLLKAQHMATTAAATPTPAIPKSCTSVWGALTNLGYQICDKTRGHVSLLDRHQGSHPAVWGITEPWEQERLAAQRLG